jgi:hypothetical protein
VDRPVTEAGQALRDLAPRLWEQPEDPNAPYQDRRSHSQSRHLEVSDAILAIEREAVERFRKEAIAAVRAISDTSGNAYFRGGFADVGNDRTLIEVVDLAAVIESLEAL